jgi:hypothetical protein
MRRCSRYWCSRPLFLVLPGALFRSRDRTRRLLLAAAGRVNLQQYEELTGRILRRWNGRTASGYTGPGILPQDIVRIFEPLYRGRRPTGDGSGLWLSIVRRVVDRYGGSIVCENITGADRSGLRATVRLLASG